MAAAAEATPNAWCPHPCPGPASMTGARSGRACLREPGQRIEFAEDPDHRRAAAPLGDERGGHVGDADLHPEPGLGQVPLQQRAALRFLESQFGPVPDLEGHLRIRIAARVEALEDGGRHVVCRTHRGERQDGERECGGNGTDVHVASWRGVRKSQHTLLHERRARHPRSSRR